MKKLLILLSFSLTLNIGAFNVKTEWIKAQKKYRIVRWIAQHPIYSTAIAAATAWTIIDGVHCLHKGNSLTVDYLKNIISQTPTRQPNELLQTNTASMLPQPSIAHRAAATPITTRSVARQRLWQPDRIFCKRIYPSKQGFWVSRKDYEKASREERVYCSNLGCFIGAILRGEVLNTESTYGDMTPRIITPAERVVLEPLFRLVQHPIRSDYSAVFLAEALTTCQKLCKDEPGCSKLRKELDWLIDRYVLNPRRGF
jgi:hypothetical protein